jgi:hypothetical protein
MKPTRPIQAELRINPKPVPSVDPERARARAGKRVRPSVANVDPGAAVEHARDVGATRQSR